MSNIILTSGIRDINWQSSLNQLASMCSIIGHFENVMLKTNGKYDDLIAEKSELDDPSNKLRGQFKGHLSRLLNKVDSHINFVSDELFLDSDTAWQALNKEHSFAFFFCSPEYYLAQIACTTNAVLTEDEDTQAQLDNWLEDAAKIWDFYVRYPENTLLINIEDIEKVPEVGVAKIIEYFSAESNDTETVEFQSSDLGKHIKPTERLISLLAQNSALEGIKGLNEVNELFENLALTSILTDDNLSYSANERTVARLEECQRLSVLIASTQSELESESATLSIANADLVADNQQLKDAIAKTETQVTNLKSNIAELETLNKEFESNSTALQTDKSALESKNTQLAAELAEQTSENELAMLQISQLQEELEATFLSTSELKELNAQLECLKEVLEADKLDLHSKNTQLTNELKALNSRLESQKVAMEADKLTLESKNTQLTTELQELSSENELAMLQINLLQEELEASFLSTTELKELLSENELAGLQINQLQEELEHYYQQLQKMSYSTKADVTYVGDVNRIKQSLSLMTLN